MQDIREIEFRDSRSNANLKICFEVRATALHPRLHTEGFSLCPHRTSSQGTSTEEFTITKLGVHNSSLQHNHLYTRDKAQSQNSHLYTRGIKALRQTPPQSPLHKRDKNKPKAQSPLHQRDEHKPKAKKGLQLLVISIDYKQFFLQNKIL